MFFLGLYKGLKSFFSLKNAEKKEKIYLVQRLGSKKSQWNTDEKVGLRQDDDLKF